MSEPQQANTLDNQIAEFRRKIGDIAHTRQNKAQIAIWQAQLNELKHLKAASEPSTNIKGPYINMEQMAGGVSSASRKMSRNPADLVTE